MRAVVFGGSGFLGSHVADELLKKGYEVIIFDKAKSGYLQSGQNMVIGDILDRQQVSAAVEGSDFVYDYAGIADLDDASTRPVDTAMLNVVGTCNILDACVTHKIRRFVYASSFYANSEKGGFYRCSKQAAEIYIEEYQRKYGQSYTILRYGSLYGPRADRNNGMREMIEQLNVVYDRMVSELHYNVTPYTYKPSINYKLVSNCYHDLGQGIIECIQEMEENADRH